MLDENNILLMVGLVIGITEVFKKTFGKKISRFDPLMKLGLGMIIGVLYLETNNIKSGILQGIIVGLAANGFKGCTSDFYRSFNGYMSRKKSK